MGLYCRGSSTEDEHKGAASHKRLLVEAENPDTILKDKRGGPYGFRQNAFVDFDSQPNPAGYNSDSATNQRYIFDSSPYRIRANPNRFNEPAPLRRLKDWKADPNYPGQHMGLVGPNKLCHNELLEDEFVVIWKALKDSRSPSSIFAWADANGKETKFSILNDAVIRDAVDWRDRSFFTVATAINIVCSTVASVYITIRFWRTCELIFLKQCDQGRLINHVASHRLDHEVSSME